MSTAQHQASEEPIPDDLRFPRREGESEAEFVERFAAHLLVLRQATEAGVEHIPADPNA